MRAQCERREKLGEENWNSDDRDRETTGEQNRWGPRSPPATKGMEIYGGPFGGKPLTGR